VGLETDRVFDCVYSNKVLHHLTIEQLSKSLHRQKEVLSRNGLVMHSFWRVEGMEEHHGLRFVYQTEDSIRAIFSESFDSVKVISYTEMEDDDSLYVLATL